MCDSTTEKQLLYANQHLHITENPMLPWVHTAMHLAT